MSQICSADVPLLRYTAALSVMSKVNRRETTAICIQLTFHWALPVVSDPLPLVAVFESNNEEVFLFTFLL